MVEKRTFTFIALALLVWSLAASFIAAYFYYAYTDLFEKTRKPIIHVNIGINYGNGTIKWGNETTARAGDTLLDATMLVAVVNYTVWLESIDGVENAPPRYWMWWKLTQFGWIDGKSAADRYIVGDEETYYWYLEATYLDETFNVMPKPP